MENWLNALEAEMFASMRLEQMKSVRDVPAYGGSRREWLF